MVDHSTFYVNCPVVEWDEFASVHLGKIAGETDAGLIDYRQSVEAGRMTLRAIEINGARVGTFSHMIDDDFCGRILFVTGMGAEPVKGFCLTSHFGGEYLPKLARDLGCQCIRFWTRRAAFVRKLSGQFDPIYVMEKRLV